MDKYVVTGLLGIILIGLLAPYFASAQVYAGDRDEMRKLVAERVVNIAKGKIYGLLNLAEENGLVIPANLTNRVDEAISILAQAEAAIDTDPNEAIRLSIKATLVFAPVARYILRNLPADVIPEANIIRLMNAINVKLGMVERLNNTVNWLDERGIPYPDEVRTLLDEAYESLIQAKSLLESGEYNTSDVAHLVGEASMKIGLATKTLYRGLHRDWVKVNIIAQAGIRMHTNLKRMVNVLNRTIIMLDEGAANVTEVVDLLNGIADALTRLADIIDRHMGVAPEQSNASIAMGIIRDALYDASDLLREAASYLEEGDTDSAIAAIQAAIDIILDAIDEAGQYMSEARIKIIKLREILPQMMDRLRDGIRRMVAARMGGLIFRVGLIEASLHAAYNRYNDGHLSKEALLSLLDRAENILNIMLERLNKMPRPPQVLVQKINNLLAWIQDVRSELSGS